MSLRKYNALLVLTLAIYSGAWFFTSSDTAESTRNFDDNPSARADWEFERTMDENGEIPADIRRRELLFSQSIPEATARNAAPVDHIGPFNVGGRTRAIAFDALDEDIMLAGGVSGGMWRTTNGGLSWTQTSDKDALYTVSCIAQDTRNGQESTWYYGTGEGAGNSASRSFSAIHYGNGVYKSTDGGLNWEALSSTQSNTQHQFDNWDFVWRLATDASNASEDEVYAAIAGMITRSVDGGGTWVTELGSTGGSYSNMGFTDVIVSSTGVVYASLGSNTSSGGIWRSEDGMSWTRISPSFMPSTYRRMTLALAPSNEDVLYVFADTPGAGVLADPNDNSSGYHSFWKYTYQSGDGSGTGGQWENRSSNLPSDTDPYLTTDHAGGYNMMVKVFPSNENIVFVGGTNLFRSDDGFASSTRIAQIGGYNPGFTTPRTYRYPNNHPDHHDVLFQPSNTSVMYNANDGGVYRTFNCLANQTTWEEMNNGYVTTQFYTVAVDPGRINNVVVGGLQDNGCWWTNSPDFNTIWKSTTLADGTFTAVESPTSLNGAGNYYFQEQFGNLYKYELNNSGDIVRFKRIQPTPGVGVSYAFVNPFELDKTDPSVIYLAAGSQILRRRNMTSLVLDDSRQNLNTGWEALSSNIGSQRLTAMSSSYGSPENRLYVGTNQGKLYRADGANLGTPSFQDISINGLNAGRYISYIAVDKRNADNILVTTSNYNNYSIFYSDDAGENWERVAGNLEEDLPAGVPESLWGIGSGPSVRSAAIVPLQDGVLYLVGTTTGLYGTTKLDGLNTVWYQQAADIIGNAVVEYMSLRPVDGFLAIGTHGSGVFTAKYQTLSEVAGYEAREDAKIEVEVYPNPSSSFISFKGLSGESRSDIRIFDMNGKQLKTVNGVDENTKLDLSDLAKGQYLVSILTKDYSQVKKITVN